MENCMIEDTRPWDDWSPFDYIDDPLADYSEDDISLFSTDPEGGTR
jgi:hypothetical protein